jgi:hypothetical protein
LQTWVLVMIVQIAAAGFPHFLPFMYSHPHFAEQGGGGQQPPVESFGVFIDFWREAVPALGRSASLESRSGQQLRWKGDTLQTNFRGAI